MILTMSSMQDHGGSNKKNWTRAAVIRLGKHNHSRGTNSKLINKLWQNKSYKQITYDWFERN